MRARRLAEVAEATGGRVEGEDVEVSSVAVDSRKAEPGALFVAVAGERRDGHAYVGDAFAHGAGAVMVRSGSPEAGGPAVRVADTGRALLDLAASERTDMPAVVVGVTGANGKTSTKDLAAALLATRLSTYESPASFNNEIGVPLTILGAPQGTEALVCEMGARRVGDVTLLLPVVRPDLVVVTNVGLAHMQIFGSWEDIVQASAEPVEALDHGGIAILNADDVVVRDFAGRTAARVLSFGTASDADVRAEDVKLGPDGRAAFTLSYGRDQERTELAVPGEHMVSNALAAAACGVALGLSAAECAAALKGARISAWRMETFTTEDGLEVVNDAYNANPESMAAGLRTARWMSRRGRMIAVLGHMAELGSVSTREHERIGELVARLGADRLVTVGEEARTMARAAVREGVEPENVACYATVEEAAGDVRAWARPGDLVFLKGSRVVGLERLAEALG